MSAEKNFQNPLHVNGHSPDYEQSAYRITTSNPVICNIQDRLDELVQSRKIKILFACESGSRVWGFSSENSDYDVRFVYVRPIEDYVTIIDRKSEIRSLPDPVYDLVGWDIVKAMRLLAKSNPNLGEWLNTDQVYRADNEMYTLLKNTYNDNFSPKTLHHHYMSMAKAVWHENLKGDQVSAKKYLYCARALLAAEWLVTKQTFPSLAFDSLIKASDASDETKQILFDLAEKKKSGLEKSLIDRVSALDKFILERLSLPAPKDSDGCRLPSDISMERLDHVFRHILEVAKGS